MRKALGALAIVLVALAARPRVAAAAEKAGPFGIGLMLGSPTGIAMKYYLPAGTQAIDAGIGGALASQNGISIHADFLWHPVLLTREDAFDMPLYVGIGARVLEHDRSRAYEDDLHVGARFPAGILFDFNDVALDVFVEAAIILDFRSSDSNHDSFGLDVNASLGARYYF